MSILIYNILLNDERKDILIESNRFTKIDSNLRERFESNNLSQIIDGSNFAILPAFYNMHTHSAMTLFRGYADDLELYSWLNDHIWPLETQLTEEDVYHGTRLAALEMIKSGTVYFNDMYFFPHGTAKAADELGVRADIAPVLIDGCDSKKSDEMLNYAKETTQHSNDYSPRVRFTVSPHAIYTVSAETLKASAELARKQNVPFQIHISETETEYNDCMKAHGKSPVQYLDSLGVLSKNVTAAHCVFLNDVDRNILKERGVNVAHCPASNMKLSSGNMDYTALRKSGIHITLATDGACSNNNLSMFDEMKIAALRAKCYSEDPTVASAKEVFKMATEDGAKAAGLRAGKIEEGYLADCMLVNLNHVSLVPAGNLISDMVYSASPECIDTLICDGRILMQGRKVEGEDDIVAKANQCYKDLISR